ncbi:MAG: RNA 2',3'-cyclic phosphodiesterase [Proteobacteria bacterium]|nr:RNA 2',3'-cyclic phosphodiesterase [Pseudomonadota bacterium]
MRAFVAVELPSAARESLATLQDRLRGALPADVRWADPQTAHLTLKFLGEIDDSRVDPLIERCRARVAGLGEIDVELAGLGVFPDAKRARVLWLGVRSGTRELARAARRLDAAAARLGVERERRPYRAHLTLGRLPTPAPLAVERLEGPKGIAFRAGDVVFYESRLSPRGARHIPLARLALDAPEAGESIDFAPEF